MSLQAFVWAIRTLIVSVGGALIALLFLLDPTVVSWYGDVLLYAVSSIFLLLFFYLSNIGIRRILFGDEKAVFFLGSALRQSFIVTILLALAFFLWKLHLLYWWGGLFLLALGLLLEFTFRTEVTFPEKINETT